MAPRRQARRATRPPPRVRRPSAAEESFISFFGGCVSFQKNHFGANQNNEPGVTVTVKHLNFNFHQLRNIEEVSMVGKVLLSSLTLLLVTDALKADAAREVDAVELDRIEPLTPKISFPDEKQARRTVVNIAPQHKNDKTQKACFQWGAGLFATTLGPPRRLLRGRGGRPGQAL